MKYVQPYGIADVDAPYINGNPSTGVQGSIPPAAAFEHPMREIVHTIEKNLVTPDTADLYQLLKATRSQRVNFAQDTGSANALSVAFDPPLTSYTLGLPIRVRVLVTNTGAATINAGAGVVNIRRPDGAANAAGDLPAGGVVDLVYDGTVFQMVNFLGAAGSGGAVTNNYQNIPYAVDTSPTPNIITASFSPAITSLSAGQPILVKVNNTNTGFTTINVNALSSKKVIALSGGELLPSDVVVGDAVLMVYDGTQFYIHPNANTLLTAAQINVPTAEYPDMTTAFKKMARKVIPPTCTWKIKMATGVYSPFISYHPQADRIVVEGTMLSTNPTFSDFAKTGSGSVARASDSANNIAMLRTRYGTEVHFVNTDLQAIQHVGPGRITFKDILITGQNVFAGSGPPPYNGITGLLVARGSAAICTNVAIWGSGSFGFMALQGFLALDHCWVCGCKTDGIFAFLNAGITTYTCGSYGNDWAGEEASSASTIYNDTSQSEFNGTYGAIAGGDATVSFFASAVTGNATMDSYASNNGLVGFNTSSMATSSPAANTQGNLGGITLVT